MKLKMKRGWSLIGIAVLGGLLVVCVPSSVIKANTNEGEDNYNHKCAVCHAKDGSGETSVGKNLKLRDLRSKAVQAESDSQLYDITAKGKDHMPGYSEQFNKDQISGLVTYIRSLAKKK